jgi:peroxiredoxin
MRAASGGVAGKDETSMNRKSPNSAVLQVASVACAWLLCVQLAGAAFAAPNLAGAEAPDFVLKSASGENLRLSEFRGEVVMLSFWATWCGECRAQLTELNDWYGTYGNAGLRLLAVGLDREFADVRETADSLRLDFPVLHDAGLEVSRLYGVEAMPVAVLIDRDGIVRDAIEGFRRTDEQVLLDRVRDLLRE